MASVLRAALEHNDQDVDGRVESKHVLDENQVHAAHRDLDDKVQGVKCEGALHVAILAEVVMVLVGQLVPAAAKCKRSMLR